MKALAGKQSLAKEIERLTFLKGPKGGMRW
jgi:hypothetical protein